MKVTGTMRRIVFLAAVPAVVFLFSCSGECAPDGAAVLLPEEAGSGAGQVISFAAGEGETRGAHARLLPDFGVFAIGSSTGGEVMYDQRVYRAVGGYTYSPLKYFPSEGLDILAYSPHGCPSVSFSRGPGLMSAVEFSLSTALTDDVLIAGPIHDVQTSPVSLLFRHPLSSISVSLGFSPDSDEVPSGKGGRITSISLIPCILSGVYDPESDTWVSKGLYGRTGRSVSFPLQGLEDVNAGSLYFIPFTAPSDAKVRIVWEAFNLSSGIATRRHTVEADLSGCVLRPSENTTVRAKAYWLADTISFEDAEAERVCLDAFDTDGDGALSYVEAESVTDLGDVFRGNATIEKFNEFVHFTGITSLPGRQAGSFASMSSLKEITLPPSLVDAGEWPFANCPSLECISVDPDNPVYYSADGCLMARNPVTLVRVPETQGPDNYEIPSGISSIGYGCFADNAVIRQIRIGKDVSSIGDQAMRIEFLESVSVDPDSQYYTVSGSALYRVELGLMTALVLLPPFCGVKTLSLPSTVREVGAYAVMRNFPLSTVVLGRGLESIGDNAFNTGLSSMTIKAATPPTLGDNVFLPESHADYTPYPIYVPSSSVSLYRSAPGWSALASRIQPIN